MASISSIKFYIANSGNRTGFNLYVDLYSTGAYSTNPGTGSLLGTASVDVGTIATGGEWVTFTFGSPITVAATGFYGILLRHNSTAYAGAGLRIYRCDDYISAYDHDATYGGDGDYSLSEYGWEYTGSWHSGSSYTWAYEVTGTDVDNNSATNVTSSYELMAAYEFGVRSYTIVSGTGAPGKASSPTPSNGATGVDKTTTEISWSSGTPAAETYNVYFGATGSTVLVSYQQAATSWTLTSALTFGQEYTWRVDTVAGVNTTTGDTWTFTVQTLNPPTDNKVVKRLVVTAKDRLYYENVS